MVKCDNSIPPHVKRKIPRMRVNPAELYGMETVLVTSSHVKRLEVTEMKIWRWACGHTLRDRVMNEQKVENIRKRCRKARWSGHVKR